MFTALVGLFGWLYHAFVEPYWHVDTDAIDPDVHRLGMLLFVTTDVATFAAGFAYYYFIRVGSWPGPHVPEKLLTPVLAVNTVVLVASSFTFERAHGRLTDGDRESFRVTVRGSGAAPERRGTLRFGRRKRRGPTSPDRG